MNSIKKTFIRLALDCQALRFGSFTLKSGRISPYFFNAGLFYHGDTLLTLGECYANTLQQHHLTFQHLFGPAYKGLPLATTTAIALAKQGINTTVTFNRKEAKDHGEGGTLMGSPLSGDTILIDDVITAGTAFREAQHLIKEHGGTLRGVIIALDRCERGLGTRSTVQEIEAQGIPVYSIITLFDLIHALHEQGEHDKVHQLEAYLERYQGQTDPM